VIARVVDVVAAGAHACAITTDKLPHCWGENTCEIFGTKDAIVDVPQRVVNVPYVSQISLASDAMCATLTEETALCWGADHKGSLGHDLGVAGVVCNGLPADPGPRHVQSPGSDLPLSPIADVHVGEGVTCARKKGGQVQCWGDNRRGAIGQGYADTNTHSRPQDVPALIAKKLDVRGQTACAVVADRLLCWGDGAYAQLDTLQPVLTCGNQVCRALPYVIPGMSPLRDVAVGAGSIATIKNDLSLWAWGRNGSGEIGVASTHPSNSVCPGAACVQQPRQLTSAPQLH
jgi:alpha-tubulin suppressor-like RCC1 family protein